MLPGREVIEVGAGTGKATEMFAVRGVRLTCLEPDPQMALVLKEKLPDVDTRISSFEDWKPAHTFDGLIAAQSWHWTDPRTRYAKAASALHESGILALFWNHTLWDRTDCRDEIDEVYRRHGLARFDERAPSRFTPSNPATRGEQSLLDEISSLKTFSDVEKRPYQSVHEYSAQAWCGLLASTSDMLILDPATREALLADIAAVIEAAGGVLRTHRRCDLFLARRTATPE